MNIQQFYESFEKRARSNGDSFVALKDSAHEDAQELVRACHGDAMPNDTIYGLIWDIARDLAESEDWDDYFPEPNPYYGVQRAWFTDVPSASDYCDESRAEYGESSEGGIMAQIAQGMAYHMQQIADTIKAGCDQNEEEEG